MIVLIMMMILLTNHNYIFKSIVFGITKISKESNNSEKTVTNMKPSASSKDGLKPLNDKENGLKSLNKFENGLKILTIIELQEIFSSSLCSMGK